MKMAASIQNGSQNLNGGQTKGRTKNQNGGIRDLRPGGGLRRTDSLLLNTIPILYIYPPHTQKTFKCTKAQRGHLS